MKILGSTTMSFELLFEVTEIGVRITSYGGWLISFNFEEAHLAKLRNMDPSSTTFGNFKLELLNEGTSEITVDLVVTKVQIVDEYGILQNPVDEWSWELTSLNHGYCPPSERQAIELLSLLT